MNIQKELQQWAENAVEEFNKLSQKSKKENKGKDSKRPKLREAY